MEKVNIQTIEEFDQWESPYIKDPLGCMSLLNDMTGLGLVLDRTEDLTWEIKEVGNLFGRDVVDVVFSTGDCVLFYKSVGLGTGIESKDEWVPIPGFTADGWFIKRHAHNKFDKYGIKTFQKVAKQLKDETRG